ncbi:hypothetical protein F5Y13DRAFT_187665 [Hypoxylon sp. FL1857]|nr:hypothetical protein F5Y13DRAFT_187665 [Hypoxylon sp. FL1857]
MTSLKDFLPRAGLVYEDGYDILGREKRDHKILTAFCKAGFVKIAKGASDKESKANVDQALADTFTVALQPHILDLAQFESRDIYAYLTSLHTNTPWAYRVGENTFFCFFWAVVEARKRWHASPRPPFDINEHSKAARQIDALLEAMGSFYSSADYEVFKLVGGLEDDDDEEDKNEDEGGKDGDIDMTDVAAALNEDIAEDDLRRGVEAMNIDDDN